MTAKDLLLSVRATKKINPSSWCHQNQPNKILIATSRARLSMEKARLRANKHSKIWWAVTLSRIIITAQADLERTIKAPLGITRTTCYSREVWLNTATVPPLTFAPPIHLYLDTTMPLSKGSNSPGTTPNSTSDPLKQVIQAPERTNCKSSKQISKMRTSATSWKSRIRLLVNLRDITRATASSRYFLPKTTTWLLRISSIHHLWIRSPKWNQFSSLRPKKFRLGITTNHIIWIALNLQSHKLMISFRGLTENSNHSAPQTKTFMLGSGAKWEAIIKRKKMLLESHK